MKHFVSLALHRRSAGSRAEGEMRGRRRKRIHNLPARLIILGRNGMGISLCLLASNMLSCHPLIRLRGLNARRIVERLVKNPDLPRRLPQGPSAGGPL